MAGLSEADKDIAALILVVGLLFVLVKVLYERLMHERFTLYNLLHPVAKITAVERHFISGFLEPFNKFDSQQKRLFLKRFAWFKSKKRFVFYGDVPNQEELMAYIAASAVLLTMGMKRYQYYRSVSRIIVYPSKYYSRIHQRHHLGEYNPRLKTLVFSADTLKEGFRIPNDRINLGIHEFSHALCYEMKQNGNWRTKRFLFGLKKLKDFLADTAQVERLSREAFFRNYGYENVYEFFAILTECFVESPKEFQTNYPNLYKTLQIMYNMDFQYQGYRSRLRIVS